MKQYKRYSYSTQTPNILKGQKKESLIPSRKLSAALISADKYIIKASFIRVHKDSYMTTSCSRTNEPNSAVTDRLMLSPHSGPSLLVTLKYPPPPLSTPPPHNLCTYCTVLEGGHTHPPSRWLPGGAVEIVSEGEREWGRGSVKKGEECSTNQGL